MLEFNINAMDTKPIRLHGFINVPLVQNVNYMGVTTQAGTKAMKSTKVQTLITL